MAQDVLREIRAFPNVLGAALVKNGEVDFSTLPDARTEIIKWIARRLENIGQMGDYVVKKMPSSSLITIKGPSPYVLSVEGKGPEGILISIAIRLMQKLAEGIGYVPEKSSGHNPGLYDPTQVGLSLDAVPIVRPGFSADMAVDACTLKILKHINGVNSIRALIRVSRVTHEEALSTIVKLLNAGVIHIGAKGPEGEDRILLRLAKTAYELDDRFSRPEEALKILGNADEVLRLLAANLHRGLTAMEYKRLADEAGLDVSLLSVIKALESLRSMGIARRKGEKRPPRGEVRRDIPRTAISVLLTTMH